jgi:hypothetical protein
MVSLTTELVTGLPTCYSTGIGAGEFEEYPLIYGLSL